MKEIMSPHTPNVRGKVTLEYSNPVTGAVEKRVEVDNYIHPNLKYLWARDQINGLLNNQYLKGQILSDEYPQMESADFFNRIILTDCSDEIDPENELYIKGKVIGAIDCRGITTSTASIAGTLNVNESFVKNGHIHIVGDFGTDRGNGTFQSIGFVSSTENYDNYSKYIAYGPAQRLTKENFYNYPNLTAFCVKGDKMYRRLYNPTSPADERFYIDVLNLNTRTSETLFSIPDAPPEGIADLFRDSLAVCDDGIFLGGRINTGSYTVMRLVKYDFSGQVVKNLPTAIPGDASLFYDDNEDVLYVTTTASHLQPGGTLNPLGWYWYRDIYKIDPDTGDLLDVIQMPNGATSSSYLAGRLANGDFVRRWSSPGESICIWESGTTNLHVFGKDSSNARITNPFITPEGVVYYISGYSYQDYYLAKQIPTPMCSRALLPAPQTKTNNYVLKVMYDIYYTDWPDIQIKPDNVFDSSLYFDGTGYVSFGNNESLNITDNLTMEILLKLDPGTPFRGFVKGISSHWDSNAYGLRHISGRTAFFIAPGVEEQRVEFDVIDNEHVHIAAVVDDEGLKVYVNYLLVDTLPRSGQPIATVTAPLVLGRAYTGSKLMLGKVYQARLWNRALTHYELTEYRNKVIASTAPGLVGNWKFDGGRDDIKDYSGNGNHGTWITV